MSDWKGGRNRGRKGEMNGVGGCVREDEGVLNRDAVKGRVGGEGGCEACGIERSREGEGRVGRVSDREKMEG